MAPAPPAFPKRRASRRPTPSSSRRSRPTHDSSQWQKAEAVLERVPGVRDGFVSAIEQGLTDEGLDWETDVAPALGDEVVIVATAKLRPIVLVEPESEEKLDALLAKSDEETVRGEVEGRVAIAEKEADLAEYRAALEQGTLESDESFAAGLDALPDESIGLVWVDISALTDELGSFFEQATQENVELGVDWLSAALSAEDDGLLVAMGARTPGGGDTHYEPELFRRVPTDAVAAVSFGGTQGALDRLQGQVDVDELSKSIEEATGVSLDGLVDALSGEGVLYVRPGGEEIPEVTLALAPPNPDKTWETVDRLARKLAAEMQAEVTTSVENGLEVSKVVAEGVTVRYARLDADTIVVTSGADALAILAGDGPKLAESEDFRARGRGRRARRSHQGIRLRRRRRDAAADRGPGRREHSAGRARRSRGRSIRSSSRLRATATPRA